MEGHVMKSRSGHTRFAWAPAVLLLGLLQIPTVGWSASSPQPDNARQVLTRGTVELGVSTGYWQGVKILGSPSANRSAAFLLPRIGVVVTDEIKADLLSGNIELIAEPLFAREIEPFAAEAAGGSLVVRYNLLSFGRWVPFWDAGAGMLWTNLAPRIEEQSTPFNFVLETGPGVHYFVTRSITLTLGVRYHHISNAGIGERNIGWNGVLSHVGISVFLW